MTVNEDLADAIVRHRVYLLRYEAGAVREIVEAYQAAVGPITKEAIKLERKLRKGIDITAADRRRLLRLIAAMEDKVRGAHALMLLKLGERIEGAQETELSLIPRLIRAALPSTGEAGGTLLVAEVPLVDAAIALLEGIGGRHWASRLALDLVQAHDRIKASIALAVIEGSSIPNTAKALRAVGGIAETYKGRLVAIARTEIQRIANDAALATYESNRDVLKGVQYLATLDSRTCVVCAPWHNVTFEYDAAGGLHDELGRPAPIVPQHPRCRCFYAPITKSWRELGLPFEDKAARRRMDGEPSLSMTFSQWLRRQPAEVQVDILGPARAKAWRGNQVPLEGFADQGKPLTLAQLRSRYPSAPLAG